MIVATVLTQAVTASIQQVLLLFVLMGIMIQFMECVFALQGGMTLQVQYTNVIPKKTQTRTLLLHHPPLQTQLPQP
jgi:hypothetical protein